MFCTKCGKKLFEGDAFCGYCGAKVREELMFKTETQPATRTPRYDEVVFNPPFKAEANRRTQHIEEEVKPYSSEPTKEKISLDWNLDGFPPAERKKDDFEINWDAVIEKKRESRGVSVEKILPETGFKTETPVVEPKKEEEPFNFFIEPKKEEAPKEEVKIDKQVEETLELFAETKDDEPLSIEDLEKALFGTEDFAAVDEDDLGVTVEYKAFKEKNKEEDFHTFNSKRDAFQELLDKERARLEALENERKSQWDELTTKDEVEYVPKKPLSFEEVFVEPKLPLVPPLKEVAVVVPPLTARVMADDPANIVEPWYEVVLAPLTARVEPLPEECELEECEPEECDSPSSGGDEEQVAEPEKHEKTKLRYSDIFPVDTFDTTDDNEPNKHVKEEVKLFLDEIDDDEDDDDEKGVHGFIKFLIVVLAIIVALELVLIGAKFMAPKSKLALMADDLMAKVTSVFVGDEDADEPVSYTEETPMEKYVSQLSSVAANIGKVESDATLKYDLSKPYAYSEIAQTSELKDVAWGADKEKTNGYLIAESIIGYYNSWKDKHPDDDIVGINQVTIGEVRTGSNGYYVLNKVIYAGTTGDVIEKYESVYLEASGDKIMVKEVKEEAI